MVVLLALKNVVLEGAALPGEQPGALANPVLAVLGDLLPEDSEILLNFSFKPSIFINKKEEGYRPFLRNHV